MPFQQFTSCIDAIYYSKTNQYVQASLVATGVVAPLAAFTALTAPWCLFMLIPIGAAAWILGYCQWFLHGRLICLPPPANLGAYGGSDQMAIGMVIDLLPPQGNTFPTSIDTDYSFGLLVAPAQPGQDMPTVEASIPYGFLISEQPATHNIGVPFTGNSGMIPNTTLTSWTLHCEFEGAGVHDLMLAAAVSLTLGVAALFVCMLVPWPLGIILASSSPFSASSRTSSEPRQPSVTRPSPSDENPALGSELHPGDLLVVSGSWVYDSGHSHDSPPRGYNEIHPSSSALPGANSPARGRPTSANSRPSGKRPWATPPPQPPSRASNSPRTNGRSTPSSMAASKPSSCNRA